MEKIRSKSSLSISEFGFDPHPARYHESDVETTVINSFVILNRPSAFAESRINTIACTLIGILIGRHGSLIFERITC